jgi:hypothetical protein
MGGGGGGQTYTKQEAGDMFTKFTRWFYVTKCQILAVLCPIGSEARVIPCAYTGKKRWQILQMLVFIVEKIQYMLVPKNTYHQHITHF